MAVSMPTRAHNDLIARRVNALSRFHAHPGAQPHYRTHSLARHQSTENKHRHRELPVLNGGTAAGAVTVSGFECGRRSWGNRSPRCGHGVEARVNPVLNGGAHQLLERCHVLVRASCPFLRLPTCNITQYVDVFCDVVTDVRASINTHAPNTRREVVILDMHPLKVFVAVCGIDTAMDLKVVPHKSRGVTRSQIERFECGGKIQHRGTSTLRSECSGARSRKRLELPPNFCDLGEVGNVYHRGKSTPTRVDGY